MTARTSAELPCERAGITGQAPPSGPGDAAVPASASARRLVAHMAAQAAETDADLAEIRLWARQHGHLVALRGRIPRHVLAAYEAAHPGTGEAAEEEPDYIAPGSVYR